MKNRILAAFVVLMAQPLFAQVSVTNQNLSDKKSNVITVDATNILLKGFGVGFERELTEHSRLAVEIGEINVGAGRASSDSTLIANDKIKLQQARLIGRYFLSADTTANSLYVSGLLNYTKARVGVQFENSEQELVQEHTKVGFGAGVGYQITGKAFGFPNLMLATALEIADGNGVEYTAEKGFGTEKMTSSLKSGLGIDLNLSYKF